MNDACADDDDDDDDDADNRGFVMLPCKHTFRSCQYTHSLTHTHYVLDRIIE